MRLHKGVSVCSLATVLAVLMLAPVAITTAAEVIEVQEECVPFRIAGNVFHQRCTSYVVYDDGTREVTSHYNRDENGMIYDP
ncbi:MULTISPECIES: hypothetical protein [unclassified Stenotrophomonas]|uniref:hypothetical protein n=1 Tax=unclassified Stenotrophomonas TaxID=196198 RepID=UPI0024498CEB|nr:MULTISPECIES: hypothetical protein [unclassified Stenotrophomonas]MBN5158750.1 hypothetical protein [Stenotrophomonas maltophilia]MDG9844898.1 hypothetical protein [Stenotrophomonas sp. GD04054]MDH0016872.1 hypothetical protein [Stenotrophomonas sp. GD04028]MDH0577353.1 hypothetical protein [Stenotrophomonas sp. GD03997]MDH0860239.1 hypothetical protein [Stenotrophomonas sp. GD03882]